VQWINRRFRWWSRYYVVQVIQVEQEISPAVQPPEGNAGGTIGAAPGNNLGAGGGGGAGAVGGNGTVPGVQVQVE
jgi:hypothetical protein